MAASIPQSLYEQLPTPVARLLRLASMTREPKKRYDYAFAAWDATFRLVVAADPPDNLTALREPSIGSWRQALKLPNKKSQTSEIVQFCAYLRQQLGHPDPPPRSVSPQQLVEHLPAYRNRFTTAHASPRASEFYVEATGHLVGALCRAWEESFFWPQGAELIFIPDIEVDEDGQHRARVFALKGPLINPLEENAPVPEEVRRGRVYLRHKGEYRSLHPWILCRPHEVKERMFLFNSSNRGYEFLDCDSGEFLGEQQLLQQGIQPADLSRLPPSVEPRPVDTSPPSLEFSTAARTPLPAEVSPRSAPAPMFDRQPSLDASPPARPTRGLRPWLAAGGALLLMLAGAMAVLPGRLGVPAISDWFFEDARAGAGWLDRCQKHLEQQDPALADVACARGLSLATSPETKTKLWAARARASQQLQQPRNAVRATLQAHLALPTPESSRSLVQTCSAVGGLPREPGALTGIKAVLPEWASLRQEASLQSPVLATLEQGQCVVAGPPAVRNVEAGGEVWFQVAYSTGGSVRRGWLREEELSPHDDGAPWLAQCRTYFEGGMVAQAHLACLKTIQHASAHAMVAEAHLIAGRVLLQGNKASEALEHLIDAHKLAPAGKTRNDAAELIESTCAAQNSPPRAAGSSRKYKVISWKSSTDRFANLRNEPSTTSSTSRILGSLPRPTCVLVDDSTKAVKDTVSEMLWYPVEVLLEDKVIKGWMHQVLLSPI